MSMPTVPPTPATLPIIIDCDPGHDDALAIMLACASPELELLGVTVTYGNVGLETTARNACAVRELIGADFVVYRGVDRPLLRSLINAESVHGASGLELAGGGTLPAPTRGPAQQHAVQFMIDTVMARPGEVTMVPTGPLTNLALALRLEPRLAGSLKEIVLMGGSLDLGNFSPAAEFNTLCDPHAAQIVFSCGAPITMFGLNVTHQVQATPPRVERFRQMTSATSKVIVGLLEYFKKSYEDRYEFSGPALHDPCPVAYLINRQLFRTKAMFVEIDTVTGPSFGRTVCDLYGVLKRPANAEVALKADDAAFFDLFTERLGRYA
jgi:purine nucleosidase